MTLPRRTPDWLLERMALGELPPEELAAARARLLEEPDGPARLAALEADTSATLERHPAAEVARRVSALSRSRRAQRPVRRFLPALALAGPALAAVLVFLVRPQAVAPRFEELPEVTRAKGLEPRLLVHRQGVNAPEPLEEGAHAAAGEVVQLAYLAAGHSHGVIFSLDGRGTLTLHAPEAGSASVPLAPSGTHPLPRAYALDDAPDFERFFLITADAPFSLEEVLAAARDLAGRPDAHTAPLSLPPSYTQTSFTLEKSSP
jgi:hypothetical protein